MNVEEGRDRITAFLDSGAWHVAADRTKTRRAIYEALLTIPDSLLAHIFADLHVLIIAPAAHRVSSIVPFIRMVAAPLEAVKFSVIHLDARIEAYEFARVKAIVGDAFRHAFASFLGVALHASGFQDEQPNGEASPRADVESKLGRIN